MEPYNLKSQTKPTSLDWFGSTFTKISLVLVHSKKSWLYSLISGFKAMLNRPNQKINIYAIRYIMYIHNKAQCCLNFQSFSKHLLAQIDMSCLPWFVQWIQLIFENYFTASRSHAILAPFTINSWADKHLPF